MLKNIAFLSVFALVVTISSCKRTYKDVDSLSPSLKSADENFGYADDNNKFRAYGWKSRTLRGNFTVTRKGYDLLNPVDYTAYSETNGDTIGFGFKFNQEVSYKIRVVGATSGAVSELFATGKESIPRTSVAVKPSGVFWFGASTSPTIFKDNMVYTYLDIYKDGQYVNIGRDSIFVTQVILPQIAHRKYKSIFIVDDFEGTAKLGTPYSDLNAAEKAAFKYNFNFQNKNVPGGGIEGLYCLYWSGSDVNYNSYVAGADENKGPGESPLAHLGVITTKDPDSVYVNAYINGTGKVGTSCLFIIWEKDLAGPYTFTGNSKYEIDRFGIQYPITWTGWRLVSVPYSAFKKLNTSYGNGNGQLNPDKFGGLSVGIDSYPTSGKEVEYFMDYIVVTEGAPFKQ